MSTIQYVVWKDDYSVGVEILDIQHKQILNIINDLYNTRYSNEKQSATGHALVLLKNYTVSHFAEEEGIMQKCGYNDLVFHKNTHDFLRQKTEHLVIMYRDISGDLSIDVLDFLKEWWTKHIGEMDRKYISCVTGRGNS